MLRIKLQLKQETGERDVAFSETNYPKRQHKQRLYAVVKTMRRIETKGLLRRLSSRAATLQTVVCAC